MPHLKCVPQSTYTHGAALLSPVQQDAIHRDVNNCLLTKQTKKNKNQRLDGINERGIRQKG